MAGDRPVSRLRSRPVENDRLPRRRHPVSPGLPPRWPLQEDVERQNRPVPHGTRSIQHPKLPRIAPRLTESVDGGTPVTLSAVTELPLIPQRITIGINGLRRVERDGIAIRQRLHPGIRLR